MLDGPAQVVVQYHLIIAVSLLHLRCRLRQATFHRRDIVGPATLETSSKFLERRRENEDLLKRKEEMKAKKKKLKL